MGRKGRKSPRLEAPITRVAGEARPLPAIIQHTIGMGDLLQEAVRVQDSGYESDSERVLCVDSNSGDNRREPGDGNQTSLAHDASSTATPRITATRSHAKDLHLSRKEKERRRRNLASHRTRQVKRIAAAKGKVFFRYRFKRPPKMLLKSLSTIKTDLDVGSLPVSGGGSFIGKRIVVKRTTPWSLDELLARGFRYIDWDGITPHAILDKDGVIIGALVGMPLGDESWPKVASEAWATLQRILAMARKEGLVGDSEHRRGKFLSLPNGVSFGGGQVRPGNLQHPRRILELIKIALEDKNLHRVAGYQSSALSIYSRNIFQEIQEAMNKLFGHYPNLKRNFSNSVYPAVTFNCGPETECLEHVDYGNAPNSLCAITALGEFDWKKGGHLILFSLGLVVPLRPGSLALIPSATVLHGNTPIQKGEKRGSMTQYCAGGLLRWVSYGFQSAKSLSTTELGREFIKKIDGQPGERWKRLLKTFTTWPELEANLNKGG